MNIKTIDDFITSEELDLILTNTIEDTYFPFFYYNDKVQVSNENSDQHHNYQLVHTFYVDGRPNSDRIQIFDPIFKKLNVGSLCKVKLNLQMKSEELLEFESHCDMGPDFTNCKTAVFYLNDNNGYTKFENGEIVESKKNRCVIFDQNIPHTGSTCTNSKYRLVLNINYYEK